MNELSLFDYSALSTDDQKLLREWEHQIKSLARMTAQGIVQIGGYLIEAKERVGHGEFLKWIASAFEWGERTAQGFMNVNRTFKSAKFADMDIDVSALYLLSAPRTPEPVRTEVIRRAEAGEPVTHEQVKLLRRRFEETGELPEDVTTLAVMASDAKQEMATRPPLPSPAAARKIAIATGAHTLSSSGRYEPPMTEADQKAWNDDHSQMSGLVTFLRWIESAGEPAEFAMLLRTRHWVNRFTDAQLVSADVWINQLREVLWNSEKEKVS